MKEVIPNLNEREKWQQQQPNLEVGDIVVIIDSSSQRGVWPTGRVTKVFPGPDGVVRSVSLLTNGTERHRPVHTLFLLESVRLQEGALSTAKRRAGDVAESTTGKTARRFPLSRVWQHSNESRGNGEEGRSYRNRKGTSRSTRLREHTHARTPSFL